MDTATELERRKNVRRNVFRVTQKSAPPKGAGIGAPAAEALVDVVKSPPHEIAAGKVEAAMESKPGLAPEAAIPNNCAHEIGLANAAELAMFATVQGQCHDLRVHQRFASFFTCKDLSKFPPFLQSKAARMSGDWLTSSIEAMGADATPFLALAARLSQLPVVRADGYMRDLQFANKPGVATKLKALGVVPIDLIHGRSWVIGAPYLFDEPLENYALELLNANLVQGCLVRPESLRAAWVEIEQRIGGCG